MLIRFIIALPLFVQLLSFYSSLYHVRPILQYLYCLLLLPSTILSIHLLVANLPRANAWHFQVLRQRVRQKAKKYGLTHA